MGEGVSGPDAKSREKVLPEKNLDKGTRKEQRKVFHRPVFRYFSDVSDLVRGKIMNRPGNLTPDK